MAIKTRVNQLEKERKARQSPKPFDIISFHLGSNLPEEVREAILCFWQNETETEYQALLAKYPEYKKGIESIMLGMNI